MARSWRDLLPKVLAEREAQAVSSVSSVSSDNGEESRPNGPNGANGAPAAIIAGLQRLRAMRCPVGADKVVWRRVSKDALRLLDEGWAAKAMALGWSDLDLFGAVPDPAGDPYSDGLAIWMKGRPLLALTAEYAVADDDNGGRSYFNRMVRSGACLLWDLKR